MKKGKIRDVQLATLIAEELELVLATANDPLLSELTVTRVEPEKGGSRFIVFLAPAEDLGYFRSLHEIEAVLKRASGFLRSELGEALNLKRTPNLSLVADPFILLPSVPVTTIEREQSE